MKILYIHQYFKTPEEGGSIRSYYLAKGLAEAGNDVVMITAHNSKEGMENVDGIKVHYLPIPYKNEFGFLRRLWAFWRFVKLARKTALQEEYVDLAYVMTTPLTTGFIATYLKKLKNIPYYFEVGDLWPEAPVKMGIINNRMLQRWLYSIERRFYFEADKVIALSPAIRNYIEKISPNTKVHVIPNIADCSFFDSELHVGDYNKNHRFHIAYCGAIGRANHLEFLLEAAGAALESGLPVDFTIMGEGSEKKRLKRMSRKLPNVNFEEAGSKDAVKDLLDRSDAVYVSFKDVSILNTGSPNKFFDSLAAGKLTIINFGGWLKNVIERNKCGFCHNPQNPQEFVRKLNLFLNDRKILQDYQQNGRKLAELYYDKHIQVTKLLKILNNEYKFEVDESEVYILTA